MVCSMTGFGRSDISENNRRFSVELRSVNNRYLDLNIRMPKRFACFESDMRSELKKYMKRGKVDVFVTYENEALSDTRIRYNETLAQEYIGYFKKIAEGFGMPVGFSETATAISASAVAGLPDVLTTEEEELPEEEIWEGLKKAIDGAGEAFEKARASEGQFLAQDMLEKLNEMEESVSFISARSPEIIDEYRQRLREKVDELLGDRQLEESRIAAEVTLYADKMCVDEELVRLGSHIAAMRKALKEGDNKDGIGRKLDFLAQEMNREANTILSKSTDLSISDQGIVLKTDIEKLREQIQNIE